MRVFWFLLFFTFTLFALPIKNSYKVLCYHNVVDQIADTKIMNITTKQLIEHFKWLKVNNYHVISIDDILLAKSGKKDLPPNAVLLTFDDGYKSFYTRVFPLLKLYNYHAIFALVGKWQDTPEDKNFLYGSIKRPRKLLLNKKEIQEMANSGFVEFASHSYDAHHGILANPQGNTEPFYSTLKYSKKTKNYESVKEYIERVSNDLKKSRDALYKYTGKYPRVIVWPYGAYTKITQKLAQKYGMYINLTLDDGINYAKDISAIKRILINSNPSFDEFYWAMQNSSKNLIPPEHSLFIDLDELYHPNPKIANKKLGILIEKIRKLKITTLVLKAYSDLDNDGYADRVYFPNHILPIQGDFLNRVAWQLQRRAAIEDIYIQMPLYYYEKDEKHFSIRDKKVQKDIYSLYNDLSKYVTFKGILFDHSKNIESIHLKSEIKFIQELYKTIRNYSGNIKTAFMISSDRFIDTKINNINKLLNYFNYLYIDTKPLSNTFSKLINKIKLLKKQSKKIVININEEKNSYEGIINQMKTLQNHGINNIAYRPILSLTNYNCNIDKLFSLRKSILE